MLCCKKTQCYNSGQKKNQFETHILPFFGKRKTNDIEAIDVGNWQANVKMKGYEEFPTIGYKDTYLKSINAELSAIFNFAVKFYKLQQNPCIPAGSMGKSKAAAMKIWTLDQYNQFISYENKEYGKLAFNLFFWCGIREGELLGLSPSRVSGHNLHIEDNFQQTSEGNIINPPKNKKTRDVSVPDFLYRQLTDYIDKLHGIEPSYSDFVGNEIIVWNPVSREKENIDDEQFKERIAGADNETYAIHAMMHEGFYEFSKTCIFCSADKGMPAKYL